MPGKIHFGPFWLTFKKQPVLLELAQVGKAGKLKVELYLSKSDFT